MFEIYILNNNKLETTYMYKQMIDIEKGEIFLNNQNEYREVIEKRNYNGSIVVVTKSVVI